MKRGEIYYIQNRETVGAETAKARPGIIVSNDILNATSGVVEIVFLTGRPKKNMPTHVEINSSGRPSTALCEQISNVSTELLGTYCGTCSVEEMANIDRALLCTLGMDWLNAATPKMHVGKSVEYYESELARIMEERDRYRRIIDKLLLIGGAE